MAIDKRGRKLPKGIRQRGNTFEGRFMYKGVSYTVQASTITKTQKEMTDLKYKLEHGLYVKKEKITLMEWYETWLEEYKKNRVKIGTYTSYEKYYKIKSDGYDFPRITSHVFRHTFATRAIEAGMPPQVLKTILGHSSLAMTMDLYSHVLPDTKADEMQKIANVF